MKNTVVIVKRYFLSGVLIVVPLILTYIVIKFLFEAIDGILQPIINNTLGYYVPGLGVFTTILLIILAGILTRNYFGARIYRLGDQMLIRLPIIRPIYSAAKQLLSAVTGPSVKSFKEVALVEYPRRGSWALCFISNRFTVVIDGVQRSCASVFVPSTPTPVSGMVVLLPVDQIHIVDMTIEEGIKFLVSGGVASPELISEKTKYRESRESEDIISETR
ncbi:MAG: hypothetical protein DRP47_11765 [Candidatus Zixiibacteriota bacterium]|nr:MAG: hypothetical protein DRP47_11765 [candidate division Zixibacteria bacterium]